MPELLPHYLGYLLKGYARLSILRKAALCFFYFFRWVFCVPPRFPNFANRMPSTRERIFSSCDWGRSSHDTLYVPRMHPVAQLHLCEVWYN
jgi:hypothetical protein